MALAVAAVDAHDPGFEMHCQLLLKNTVLAVHIAAKIVLTVTHY